MSKHTPTPWTYQQRKWNGEPSPYNLYICGNEHVEFDDDGDEVFTSTAVAVVEGNATAGDIPLLNAQLICTAANSHHQLTADLARVTAERDRLRAVLKRLHQLIDFDDLAQPGKAWEFTDVTEINAAMTEASAALKQ